MLRSGGNGDAIYIIRGEAAERGTCPCGDLDFHCGISLAARIQWRHACLKTIQPAVGLDGMTATGHIPLEQGTVFKQITFDQVTTIIELMKNSFCTSMV
jgi:hypothetical protein